MLTLPLGAFPFTFHVDGMTLKKDGQPDCALFNPVQMGLQRLAEIERRRAERALNSAWVLEDGEEIVSLMSGEFRAQWQEFRRMPQYSVRYDGDSKRRWDELCARVDELTAQDGRPGSLVSLRNAIRQQAVRGDVMSVSPPPQPVLRRAAPIEYIEISSGDEMEGIEEPKPPKPFSAPKRHVKFHSSVRAKIEVESSSSSESESDSDSSSDKEEGLQSGPRTARHLRSSVAHPKPPSGCTVPRKQPGLGDSDNPRSMANLLKRRRVESPTKCERCVKSGQQCTLLADRPVPGRACIQCRSQHRGCSHTLKT
ncbi:hypothetical protein CYLTODRAFT_422192 [Cylindrobasidium torrendii FP15055 ss-10]|uniref:Zn(2)-C6 fungal-type domain-containing protein n=1 Tax=Cylindrobasidium torrendii FP15055 ss-10 TaxID=1314674 RepID=A0A0D7BE07_9AGAR|nr:hypothetical protein CYLTODRAFT_422192 [Cylindrobasidium torrendii FP15055 ss-10]